MIKVTIEFLTVDAAIVALGKLSSVAPAAVAQPGKGPAAQTVQSGATEPKQRKGRADKGQPRGKRGQNAGDAEPPAQPQAAPAAAPAPVANPAVEAGREGGIAGAGGTAGAGKQADAGKVGEPANPTSTPPASAPATLDEAQAALSKVFEAHGLPKAQEVLSRFGVQRLRDLLPEQRAEFIADATAAAAK